MSLRTEVYSWDTFHCEYCKNDFQASIVSWVDVSMTPQFKKQLQQWEFNIITCPNCRNRQFSSYPFFYEDFAEGLLIAVFPIIPENHLSLEYQIRQAYGYYPILDFFYDITQLWFLLYLQDYYGRNKHAYATSKIGLGDDRLRRFLQFLKKDPFMLTLRNALKEAVSGNKTAEDLQNVLWCALAKLEGATPSSQVAVTPVRSTVE